MEELLDIYTCQGIHIGIKSRKECHSENINFYHKPAWSWIYNNKGELLVQKRSKQKKNFPCLWDMPCAGHVSAGESIIQGLIREVKEEIGIDIKENDCKFVFEYLMESAKEIGQVYFIKIDKKEDEFILQEEEVELVKWVSFKDFKELLYSNQWIPYDKEYKDKVVKELENILNKQSNNN